MRYTDSENNSGIIITKLWCMSLLLACNGLIFLEFPCCFYLKELLKLSLVLIPDLTMVNYNLVFLAALCLWHLEYM